MSVTVRPEHVPHHLRRHPVFLLALAVVIVVPPLIVFYMPSVVTGVPDWIWLVAGFLLALLCILAIDEVWIREERKVIGASHADHISHRVLRNGLFLLALVVLIFAPPPVAFYMPQVLTGTPDWLWLIAAWALAVLSTLVAYSVISGAEKREMGNPA